MTSSLAWRARYVRNEISRTRVRLDAWRAWRRQRSRYTVIDETALRATRRSDAVFIFGSGASLNDIPSAEWHAIAAHDTLGFNWFVRQRFVRCDYHLIREVCYDDVDERVWRPQVEEFSALLSGNPCFAGTTLLVQTGFRATNANRVMGSGTVPTSRPLFLWKSRRGSTRPTTTLADGLSHAHGTLQECVNFAFLLGWKTIVLAGVDLYDRRYFWTFPPDPSGSPDALHRTASTGLIESLGEWRDLFLQSGVRLFVYNPRSLLAGCLPLWQWNAEVNR